MKTTGPPEMSAAPHTAFNFDIFDDNEKIIATIHAHTPVALRHSMCERSHRRLRLLLARLCCPAACPLLAFVLLLQLLRDDVRKWSPFDREHIMDSRPSLGDRALGALSPRLGRNPLLYA